MFECSAQMSITSLLLLVSVRSFFLPFNACFCLGSHIVNGGRKPVEVARKYREAEIVGDTGSSPSFVEATVRGLLPDTNYEFVVACRNILLEDCGPMSCVLGCAAFACVVIADYLRIQQ